MGTKESRPLSGGRAVLKVKSGRREVVLCMPSPPPPVLTVVALEGDELALGGEHLGGALRRHLDLVPRKDLQLVLRHNAHAKQGFINFKKKGGEVSATNSRIL